MPAPEIVCDLVLLSWNHLEETRPCLETLFAATTVASRLFIVDNASEPPVRDFLSKVKPQGAIQEVILLQNEKNEGFPKGMNRGIAACTAPYVCLLNNDLLFTEGWLEEMMAVARANTRVGVVNPASSTFGERPAAGETPQAYAARRVFRKGQYTEVGMCIGFCLLVRRELLVEMGGFTQEVDRAFFEDEDLSVRIQQAGYQCVVAEGAYVYHTEHRSVRDVPERQVLFSKNQRWCHEKWGRWVRVAWPNFKPLVPGSEELRRWLSEVTSWARKRTHVYAYCVMPAGFNGKQLFESVGLIAHADVRWQALPPGFARLAALLRIILRQKKRFDIIVAPDERWAALANVFSQAHRAPVVVESNQEGLKVLWKQKSQSVP